MTINRPYQTSKPPDDNRVPVEVLHHTLRICHQQHHLKHHWKRSHRDHNNHRHLVHQEVVEDPPDVFTVELVDVVLVVPETEISKKDDFLFLVVMEHPALLVKNQESPQAAQDKKEKLTKR